MFVWTSYLTSFMLLLSVLILVDSSLFFLLIDSNFNTSHRSKFCKFPKLPIQQWNIKNQQQFKSNEEQNNTLSGEIVVEISSPKTYIETSQGMSDLEITKVSACLLM
ncbi:unnamed protein product [Onchocerca ochengi]|uniref:Uncharacterized protein n=1 Tax=Onchocerca ochengi TaxID=42157 RepID=A0A182EC21_ONCOC|nr:unnamed protein product [Onchocerca ochengi]